MNETEPISAAASSGCGKHHNNDKNCLYKGANTGIKMTYDNVVTPAPSGPLNETHADGTSGGTLMQVKALSAQKEEPNCNQH